MIELVPSWLWLLFSACPAPSAAPGLAQAPWLFPLALLLAACAASLLGAFAHRLEGTPQALPAWATLSALISFAAFFAQQATTYTQPGFAFGGTSLASVRYLAGLGSFGDSVLLALLVALLALLLHRSTPWRRLARAASALLAFLAAGLVLGWLAFNLTFAPCLA